MKNYISSEYLKHKNTFAKKLVWLAPILTLCLNVLTPMWYQQNSYNWWYVFLYPGCLMLLSILIIQRDNGKLKFRAILSLPVDLKKVWYAKIITCIIYIVLANTILMLCNVAGIVRNTLHYSGKYMEYSIMLVVYKKSGCICHSHIKCRNELYVGNIRSEYRFLVHMSL